MRELLEKIEKRGESYHFRYDIGKMKKTASKYTDEWVIVATDKQTKKEFARLSIVLEPGSKDRNEPDMYAWKLCHSGQCQLEGRQKRLRAAERIGTEQMKELIRSGGWLSFRAL